MNIDNCNATVTNAFVFFCILLWQNVAMVVTIAIINDVIIVGHSLRGRSLCGCGICNSSCHKNNFVSLFSFVFVNAFVIKQKRGVAYVLPACHQDLFSKASSC